MWRSQPQKFCDNNDNICKRDKYGVLQAYISMDSQVLIIQIAM